MMLIFSINFINIQKGICMIDKKLFGKRIKELREKHNMTQEELSVLLNVEWQHISRLETGKNLPSCPILISLAKIFDIDIRTLVDYEYLDDKKHVDKSIENLLNIATDEQKCLFYKILKAILK